MKHNIYLAFSFAKRDFKERYVGTSLGQLWYILSPIITIMIYTIIFSDFMSMKLDIVDSSYSYSIYLIAGLLAWTSFSTTILRLNNSIFEKSNLIKKINVPVFVYQLSIIITEYFLLLLSYLLSIIFLLLVDHPVTWSFLYLAPILFIQTLFAYGLGTVFSLFNVFIKDLKEAIPILTQLWFWMTPIVYVQDMVAVYVQDMVADKYPFLLTYNPFYYFANIYQNIFLYSKAPSLNTLVFISVLSILAILIAGFFYKKMIAAVKDII